MCSHRCCKQRRSSVLTAAPWPTSQPVIQRVTPATAMLPAARRTLPTGAAWRTLAPRNVPFLSRTQSTWRWHRRWVLGSAVLCIWLQAGGVWDFSDVKPGVCGGGTGWALRSAANPAAASHLAHLALATACADCHTLRSRPHSLPLLCAQCGVGHLARVLNTLLVEHIRGLLPSLRNKIGESACCQTATCRSRCATAAVRARELAALAWGWPSGGLHGLPLRHCWCGHRFLCPLH